MEEIFETFLKDLDRLHNQGMQALKEYKLKKAIKDNAITNKEQFNKEITPIKVVISDGVKRI